MESLAIMPIMDVVRHGIPRYGDPLDAEIRKLGELMSYHRLCAWFEQHSSKPPEQLQLIVSAKLEEVRRAAKEGGWQSDP